MILFSMIVYLGCYTDETHPNGLKALQLDEKSGAMAIVAEYPVPNALYQALSPDGKWLYSCSGEGLAAFDVSREPREGFLACRTGESGEFPSCLSCTSCLKLSAALREPLALDLCHIAAMPDGKRVVFADYRNGFAGSVAVEGGRFGEPIIHRHSGSGPNLPRQDKAHCHQALPLPDGSGYAVCDLGLDEIVEYPSGRIFKTTPAGAGPRHLLFHPNGRLAFLVSELGNFVSSLAWSPADGFRTLDTLSTIISQKPQESFKQGVQERQENNSPASPVLHAKNLCACAPPRETNPVLNTDSSRLAAAIRFTPDMKRIVVSNRGENSLVVFDFDEATGRLAFKARTFLSGSWPRDFIFVSSTLALVAMERSGEVHVLRYDSSTGLFERIATLGGVFRPVALLAGQPVLYGQLK